MIKLAHIKDIRGKQPETRIAFNKQTSNDVRFDAEIHIKQSLYQMVILRESVRFSSSQKPGV